MTTYYEYKVRLTDWQKGRLMKSLQKRAPLTLRLSHSRLSVSDKLALTRTQIKRIEKSRRNGTGVDIKISLSQMRKQDGGNLFSALVPMLRTAAPAILKTVGLSGLSGLVSGGVEKAIKGSGSATGGGLFSVPQDKVDKLIRYKDYLTAAQKKQITQALQTGSGISRFRLTNQQQGGYLGTLLASIGIPLLSKALTGKGLQVEPRVAVEDFMLNLPSQRIRWMSSFQLKRGGVLRGEGKKIEKRQGSSAWPQQPLPKRSTLGRDSLSRAAARDEVLKHSTARDEVLKARSPRFVNKPLSSHDLLEWVEELGIRNFRGVFSRDNLPKAIRKRECGIINLDDQAGPGTHWVCYRNLDDDFCEYFDSFGLRMPYEVEGYLSGARAGGVMKSGKQLIYSSDEIQERDSVLCGYWSFTIFSRDKMGEVS